MKYHILGISPDSITFSHLLCRYTDPSDVEELRQKELDLGVPDSQGEIMLGSFTGTLPDPATSGLEALTFDTIEAADAKIRAELAAGSTFIYALHYTL
jgi:hypothetical protein